MEAKPKNEMEENPHKKNNLWLRDENKEKKKLWKLQQIKKSKKEFFWIVFWGLKYTQNYPVAYLKYIFQKS